MGAWLDTRAKRSVRACSARRRRKAAIRTGASRVRRHGGAKIVAAVIIPCIPVSRICRSGTVPIHRQEKCGSRGGRLVCKSDGDESCAAGTIATGRNVQYRDRVSTVGGRLPKSDIIVVGASAGGVQALKKVAADLPSNLPAAVFAVLHIGMGINGSSALPSILARAGRLPAKHPRDGEEIRPGIIYIAPPDCHMLLSPGCIHLSGGPK